MAGEPRNKPPSGRGKGLTPIHQGIHCAATTDGVEVLSEIDQMAVDHFIKTLAQVALAVASRQLAVDGNDVTCEQ